MKTRIFWTSLLIGLLLVFCASSAVWLVNQQSRARLNLSQLENGLYQGNAELVRWAMSDLNAARLAGLNLPQQLAEIVLLEPASLKIVAATVPSHNGKLLPEVPNLLDRAEPLMQALNSTKLTEVKGRDYTLIIRPAAGGLYLVAFKPRAAETALLASQQLIIAAHFKRQQLILLGLAMGGSLLALILAVVIARLAAGSHNQALKAFDELSRGNFAAEPAGLKPDEARIYARLHASLSLALERLGRI